MKSLKDILYQIEMKMNLEDKKKYTTKKINK